MRGADLALLGRAAGVAGSCGRRRGDAPAVSQTLAPSPRGRERIHPPGGSYAQFGPRRQAAWRIHPPLGELATTQSCAGGRLRPATMRQWSAPAIDANGVAVSPLLARPCDASSYTDSRRTAGDGSGARPGGTQRRAVAILSKPTPIGAPRRPSALADLPDFALTAPCPDAMMSVVTLAPRRFGAVSDPARKGPGAGVCSLKTEQYSSA